MLQMQRPSDDLSCSRQIYAVLKSGNWILGSAFLTEGLFGVEKTAFLIVAGIYQKAKLC